MCKYNMLCKPVEVTLNHQLTEAKGQVSVGIVEFVALLCYICFVFWGNDIMIQFVHDRYNMLTCFSGDVTADSFELSHTF